jgi:primosomal protein N'
VSAVPQAQPPQRLCPHCSTIARTPESRCPYCGSSYLRRGPWGAALFAALLTTVAVLAGVVVVVSIALDRAERELDRTVQDVRGQVERDVTDIQRRIERELDERLPDVPLPGP